MSWPVTGLLSQDLEVEVELLISCEHSTLHRSREGILALHHLSREPWYLLSGASWVPETASGPDRRPSMAPVCGTHT